MQLSRGSRVGRYRVVEPLGEGGMGAVFRATDINLGRDVAIKVVSASLVADDDALSRFDREARLLATINHPNIESIYGLEEHEGQKFIVLEFVEGETLAERIARGPLPVNDVLEIGRQITLGLEASHERGIIHRDVKPANIKITAGGTVKLLDFGLAKALTSAPPSDDSETKVLDRTRAGVVVGTPLYMSPEQLRGGPVDERTDVWSTGCVLFEALTATRPFRSDTYSDTVAAILQGSPSWAALPPAVPQYVRRIIERCLRKEPGERFSGARELRLAMESARSASRNGPRSLWLAGGAVAALAIIAAAFVYVRQGRDQSARPIARIPSQFTIASGVEDFPTWSPDGESVAFSADAGPVRKIFIKSVGSTSERQLTRGSFDDVGASWAPDGSSIVFQRGLIAGVPQQPGDVFDRYESGEIWRIDVATGAEKKILHNAFGASFSPDGKRLAFDASYAGPRRIWISDANGLNPQQLTTDSTEAATHIRPRWSPDGRRIVFQRIERTKFDVSVVNVESRRTTSITNDAIVDVNPVFSANGDSVYFSSPRGGGMNVWRIAVDATSHPVAQPEQITFGPGQDVSIAVSPKSGQLAFVTLHQNADIWRVPAGGGAASALVSTTREESRGEWSRDGKLLAFNFDRGGDMNIWTMDGQTGNLDQLTSGKGGDYQPTWSGDGSTLAFLSSRSGNLDVWVVTRRDKRLRQLTKAPGIDVNPFISPDGKTIAYQSDASGRLELWLMKADGSGARQLTRDGIGGHFMRWMRDGSRILCRLPGAGVAIVAVDGSAPTLLSHVKGGSHLSLSPDETHIADVIGHKTIWVSPVASGEPRALFAFEDPQIRIDYPVWSPDGGSITFDRFKPEGGDVWLLQDR
jgi:serine/threonine-protein kinase